MNVLMISPGFPAEMPQFTRGLACIGAGVIGIGEQPESQLPAEARSALRHYAPVASLWDEAAVLAEARRLGWTRVMLVGDAPYYARFGFSRLDGVTMPPPTNPDRVLGLDLVPGAWAGVAGRVEKAA